MRSGAVYPGEITCEDVARACGVDSIQTVGSHDLSEELEKVFQEVLERRELSMVIVKLESRKTL